MTSKKAAVSIAYVAILMQLVTYFAHDTGRLTDGRLYWVLLYASSISLLGAVLWIAWVRTRSQHSRDYR